jgi:hypothetical protein
LQVPVQALLQQTPSTQNRLTHSMVVAQTAPRFFFAVQVLVP